MTEKKSATAIIVPQGTLVALEQGLSARVFPMGFAHIQRFSGDLGRVALALVQALEHDKAASEMEVGAAVAAQALPVLVAEAMDLVLACTRFESNGEPAEVKFEDLPHWWAPPIIEAWLVESFGEEKKRDPWVRAIESTIARVTGAEVKISGMLSKAWSSLATSFGTSSEDSK